MDKLKKMKARKNLYKTSMKSEVDYQVQWGLYSKIIKKIKLKKGEKILDAGCGNGKLAEHLKNCPSLYGFDFEGYAVEEAKKKNYKQVLKRDIVNTKYKDKEFDTTICIQVFPYLTNPEKAFKELLRITKKRIIISVPNYNWLRIKSISSKRFKRRYHEDFHSNHTGKRFLIDLAKKYNLALKIFYLSNNFGFIRNLYGNYFASEVIGIFYIK